MSPINCMYQIVNSWINVDFGKMCVLFEFTLLTVICSFRTDLSNMQCQSQLCKGADSVTTAILLTLKALE